MDDDNVVNESLQQLSNVQLAISEIESVPPSDVGQVRFDYPPQSTGAQYESKRLVKSLVLKTEPLEWAVHVLKREP